MSLKSQPASEPLHISVKWLGGRAKDRVSDGEVDDHAEPYFTEMCSGSEAGSYLRLIDFVYHSTLGLSVTKKKRAQESGAEQISQSGPEPGPGFGHFQVKAI